MTYLVFHNFDFLCINHELSIFYVAKRNELHIYPKLIEKKNWAAAPLFCVLSFRSAVRMRKAFVSFPRRSWC